MKSTTFVMPYSWKQLGELPQEVRRPLTSSLIITSIITLLSSTSYLIVQPVIPLFNSLPLSQVLVPKIWLLLFPALSLSITLLHVTLSWMARNYQPMALRLFAWLTLILQLLLLSIIVRLLWLVL